MSVNSDQIYKNRIKMVYFEIGTKLNCTLNTNRIIFATCFKWYTFFLYFKSEKIQLKTLEDYYVMRFTKTLFFDSLYLLALYGVYEREI